MKWFRRFLQRTWAKLKSMFAKSQIVIQQVEPIIDAKLAEILIEMKSACKSMAREKLAAEGRIANRNTYRARLEDEARRIFERILSLNFESAFVAA